MISGKIEDIIISRVKSLLEKGEIAELPKDIVATDTIGEVIEKLIIVHIRQWMLEDALGVAKTDSEILSLQRKLDICLKQKRPKYVEAINRMLDDAVVKGKSLKEDSVKLYKGY